jgi:DNA polymerase-3 subunit epsilon
MQLFAPALAFVDLETTGTGAASDAITEIGIVRVEAVDPAGPPVVTEWSTLVDPGVPIPPEIQALTGISDAMVRNAPTFAQVASEVRRARTTPCSSRTTPGSITVS